MQCTHQFGSQHCLKILFQMLSVVNDVFICRWRRSPVSTRSSLAKMSCLNSQNSSCKCRWQNKFVYGHRWCGVVSLHLHITVGQPVPHLGHPQTTTMPNYISGVHLSDLSTGGLKLSVKTVLRPLTFELLKK